MNDKKIELISAKGAMGVTEFALLYFPESPPETAYKRMAPCLERRVEVSTFDFFLYYHTIVY